jgi:hypothetical protein
MSPSSKGEEAFMKTLSAAEIRRLAVQASVDPKSIVKVARGERVRGMAGDRALGALRESGFIVPEPGGDLATGDSTHP